MTGTVHTETTIYSPPEAFAGQAPYQLALIDLDTGARLTARIHGDPVRIGDRVALVEVLDSIPYFRKANHEVSHPHDPPRD
jgi:uncharacterized OB-fold protein